MEENSTRAQFDAYFKKQLSQNEKQQLEAQLKSDAALQKAFFIYAMKKEEPTSDADRSKLEQIRQQKGPLPEPNLSIWDQLRFTFLESRPLTRWLGILLLVLVVATVVWVINDTPPPEGLITTYFQEAYCPGVAGANDLSLFYQAASTYCGATESSLNELKSMTDTCQGFCIAQYYLAHQQLKNKEYQEAEAGFIASINNTSTLQQFYAQIDPVALELNRLLCQLGQGDSRKSILQKLEVLLQESPANGLLEKEINGLLDALQ
jgi:hypothetical protein